MLWVSHPQTSTYRERVSRREPFDKENWALARDPRETSRTAEFFRAKFFRGGGVCGVSRGQRASVWVRHSVNSESRF